jgi:hypothetical protein
MHMNAWKMNIVFRHLKRFMTEKLSDHEWIVLNRSGIRGRLVAQTMENEAFYAGLL